MADTGKTIALIKALGGSGGGSGGGVLHVGAIYDENTVTLDKTWQDIYECDIPVCNYRGENYIDFDEFKITHAEYDPRNQYYFVDILIDKDPSTGSYQTSMTLTTPTANGYPSVTMG